MKQGFPDRLRSWVANPDEAPALAGLAAGGYALLFYVSHNFSLASSWQGALFYLGYYLVLPVLSCILVSKIFSGRWLRFRRQALFVCVLGFFAWFLLQLIPLGYSHRRLFVLAFGAIALVSFRFSNYKALIPLIGVMAVFPVIAISGILMQRLAYAPGWNDQTDHILSSEFKQKPNIYFIQTDGYPSIASLSDSIYNIDNSAQDRWFSDQGFTQYPDFRSNYRSTLQSNSSCFEMRHHYYKEDIRFTTDADYIMGENAVLSILKANGYTTEFISERPYLLMNRPEVAYDYTNFQFSELPFLGDGWSIFKDITPILQERISQKRETPVFYFVEKFDPGHIAVSDSYSKGKDKERLEFIRKLGVANDWLQKIVPFILEKDPEALILVAADHGGFVGFNSTDHALAKIDDPQLLRSIFGARLAIRWPNPSHREFDARLKTSVNTFRVVFAFLSNDKTLLKSLQPDVSYNLSTQNPESAYPAIP